MDPIIANLALNLGGQVLNRLFPTPAVQSSPADGQAFAQQMEHASRASNIGIVRISPSGSSGVLPLAEARQTLTHLLRESGLPIDLASLQPGSQITLQALSSGGWSLQIGDSQTWQIHPDAKGFSQASLLAAQLEAIDFQEMSTVPTTHASHSGSADLSLTPGFASWSFTW